MWWASWPLTNSQRILDRPVELLEDIEVLGAVHGPEAISELQQREAAPDGGGHVQLPRNRLVVHLLDLGSGNLRHGHRVQAKPGNLQQQQDHRQTLSETGGHIALLSFEHIFSTVVKLSCIFSTKIINWTVDV